MDTKKLLLELSAKTGVAGREGEAAAFGREILSRFGKTRMTALGSVICEVRAPKAGGPHIMLDAHMDELGLVVTYIEEEGFLRVAAVGGVDRRLLLASPVTVHGRETLAGLVCSIPPHLNKEKDGGKNKKPDEIYIDIGAESREEAAKLARPGDIVTLDSRPRELLNGLISAKAIDDRAGCAAIVKALEYLEPEKNPLGCGLTAVFSSMEEVGGQGAKTAAHEIAPTHAVAIDMSFAYTPDSRRDQTGDLKKGPMIGFAPILEHGVSERLCTLAEERGIPYQREVMGGRTGTNADVIAVSRGGVRTALISIPQKYMHTPIEAIAVEDVENTARLIAAYVRDIGGEENA
jgi:endoglucanase